MAIKTDIRGLIWRYPEPFVVGREKIREFAKAIKAEDPACYDEAAAAELGYDSVLAPLTFVAILAKLVQSDFFRNVDTGYTTMQMVQVDQGFTFHRPIKAGDTLYARMEIASVNERFGADIVTTRNVLTDPAGEVVMESFTTLMGHEGDNSISAGWDPETGQVVRKPVVHDVEADGQEAD
jgi:acyl dehydratase